MGRLSQGQIWWANLPAPAGRRPVLVLTRSDALSRLSNATVAPLTRSVREIPSEVPLSPAADGVPTECAVSLENILTVPRDRLEERIVSLGSERMEQVFDAISYVFAMRRR